VSAFRTSTAAGSTGMAQQLGESKVGLQVLSALLGARPLGVLALHLAPELVGDADAFCGTEARDPLGPEGVLRAAGELPVAADVVADAPGDHQAILLVWVDADGVRAKPSTFPGSDPRRRPFG